MGGGFEMDESPLDVIQKACLDSPGYVVFAAILSQETDAQGNPQVTFRYQRNRFSLEDTQQAIRQFQKHLDDEVNNYFHSEDGVV